MNKPKRLQFRLTGHDYEWVFKYAKKHKVKVSDVMRTFIKDLRLQDEVAGRKVK